MLQVFFFTIIFLFLLCDFFFCFYFSFHVLKFHLFLSCNMFLRKKKPVYSFRWNRFSALQTVSILYSHTQTHVLSPSTWQHFKHWEKFLCLIKWNKLATVDFLVLILISYIKESLLIENNPFSHCLWVSRDFGLHKYGSEYNNTPISLKSPSATFVTPVLRRITPGLLAAKASAMLREGSSAQGSHDSNSRVLPL